MYAALRGCIFHAWSCTWRALSSNIKGFVGFALATVNFQKALPLSALSPPPPPAPSRVVMLPCLNFISSVVSQRGF